MNELKRQNGSETYNRLLEWDKGQTPSERLASRLLSNENYSNVDPSHPLGGKDGGKDAFLEKDGLRLILAVYFPRGQKSIKETIKKFRNDLKGVKNNVAKGIVFFTNQELSLSERQQLITIADGAILEIYHLERIANLLDIPRNYGLRLEFLQISMSHEEMLAFYAQRDEEYLNRLLDINNQLESSVKNIIGQTTGGNSYPVIFADREHFCLCIIGDYPLKNLKVFIFDHDLLLEELFGIGSKKRFNILEFSSIKNSCLVHFGTLDFVSINLTYILKEIPIPIERKKKFFFEINSLNNSFSGMIFVKLNNEETNDIYSVTSVYNDKQELLYQKDNERAEIKFFNKEPVNW